MSSNTLVNHFPRFVSEKSRNKLASFLSQFRFCRVEQVFPLSKVNHFTLSPSDTGDVIFHTAPEGTNDERYSVNECDNFTIKPGKAVHALTNREYPPEYLYNRNCLKLSFTEEGFQLEHVVGKTIPYASKTDKADLIAYIPAGQGARAVNASWFICSEQFMRLCTIVQHDKHPSYKNKKGQTVPVFQLKEWFCNANRLRPDSCRSYVLARTQNNIPLEEKDLNERFWARRTEEITSKYPDLYVAIARMVVFGEILCYSNVPTVAIDAPPKADTAGQAQQQQWCAPVEVLVKFMISCGWEIEDFEEEVKKCTGIKPAVLLGNDLKKERNNLALKEKYEWEIKCVEGDKDEVKGCAVNMTLKEEFEVFQEELYQ